MFERKFPTGTGKIFKGVVKRLFLTLALALLAIAIIILARFVFALNTHLGFRFEGHLCSAIANVSSVRDLLSGITTGGPFSRLAVSNLTSLSRYAVGT